MPQQKTVYQEVYEQHKLLDIDKFFLKKKNDTKLDGWEERWFLGELGERCVCDQKALNKRVINK